MQKIIPNLWFNKNAEEAVNYYLSVFPNSKLITTTYYPTEGLMDFQKDFAGKVLTIDFEVNGQVFTAINAGDEFKFTEAVSFLIYCKDQEEIDYYWNEFTKNGGEESVCGRCKDKYGMNRQINPENMAELMNKPDAYGKLMNMKKIIISEF
jgi:predicted 3-demethylubiquinone-9 3-methyltransferase (glyoxalase superfamily)